MTDFNDQIQGNIYFYLGQIIYIMLIIDTVSEILRRKMILDLPSIIEKWIFHIKKGSH